jgi:hypothetical protein
MTIVSLVTFLKRCAAIACPVLLLSACGGQAALDSRATAYLRIVKVQGRRAAFELDTQPSSWPAPKLR